MLPETELWGAQEMAEILRHGVESLAINHEASSVADVVSISLGGAVCIPHSGIESWELIRAADANPYESKLAGRNRVSFESGGCPAVKID